MAVALGQEKLEDQEVLAAVVALAAEVVDQETIHLLHPYKVMTVVQEIQVMIKAEVQAAEEPVQSVKVALDPKAAVQETIIQ